MTQGRKRIGFLSFGHYRDVPGARVATGGDSLRQHVDLAQAAEEVGFSGAWLCVHHFEHSLTAPYPLLSAMAARTTTLEVGTGVVDMRYENPLYSAELAAATDLISGGRLQLGISRGSPEQAVDGQAAFGYELPAGRTWAEEVGERTDRFLAAVAGEPMARSARAGAEGAPTLRVEPHSPGLRERIWWGAGKVATADYVAEKGMNLLSSTLLLQDDGRPFHVQQADQIRRYRAARADDAGLAAVTRSAFPVTTEWDERYFGFAGESSDSVGYLDGSSARSGPTVAGPPESVARSLLADEAVQEADYVLFALPSQLGTDYNAHLLGNIADVARELGWLAPRM